MSDKIKIKVCGMREHENIMQLCELKPDYIGFIFYPKSKRFIGKRIPSTILEVIPPEIKKVGVFVNENPNNLIGKAQVNNLDYVQLHGDETPRYCQNIKELNIKIIKAFSIKDQFQFTTLNKYKSYCEFFLFDTFTPEYGGSGNKFNWKILESYTNDLPIFLSGGISLNEVDEIKNLNDLNIHAVDINSKFEVEPGLKDINKIQQFIKAIRNE